MPFVQYFLLFFVVVIFCHFIMLADKFYNNNNNVCHLVNGVDVVSKRVPSDVYCKMFVTMFVT